MASSNPGSEHIVLFRLCRTIPPTLGDFLSHKALGRPLRDPQSEELWDGISCFSTEEEARRALIVVRKMVCVAELALPPDARCTYRQTGLNEYHHTVWGEPEYLSSLVRRIIPLREG